MSQDNSSVNDALKNMSARTGAMESTAAGGVPNSTTNASRRYLPEKSMIPGIFNGEVDGWRVWRDDVSDFFDTRNVGMQKVLVEIGVRPDTPTHTLLSKMSSLGPKVLGDSLQVWRALKALTSGNARTVIQSVEGEDGFEAWKRLHHRYEPKLVIKQGQVLAEFAAMVATPARSIAETQEDEDHQGIDA